MHYLRWYKHGDPSAKLNRWGEDTKAETKFCKYCERDLPVDSFYKRGDNATGRVHKCKECWKPSPEKVRERNLRQYGITPAQYDELLAQQGGRCALCPAIESSKGKSLCVDHNHTTGEVRGLLCSPCNAGIGMLKEDIHRLFAVVSYLFRFSVKVEQWQQAIQDLQDFDAYRKNWKLAQEYLLTSIPQDNR